MENFEPLKIILSRDGEHHFLIENVGRDVSMSRCFIDCTTKVFMKKQLKLVR